MYELPEGKTVRDYMTRVVATVNDDTLLITIAGMFASNSYRRIPVVDREGRLVGQISRRDVLKGIKRVRNTKRRYPDYRRPFFRGN